jgi:transcriptional regulator with XRE-family HTH domain
MLSLKKWRSDTLFWLKRPGHNTLNKIVGRNLRRLRGKLHLSQDDFADRANIHRTYIGAIERGEQNITLSTLELLAATLKAKPVDLLVMEEED